MDVDKYINYMYKSLIRYVVRAVSIENKERIKNDFYNYLIRKYSYSSFQGVDDIDLLVSKYIDMEKQRIDLYSEDDLLSIYILDNNLNEFLRISSYINQLASKKYNQLDGYKNLIKDYTSLIEYYTNLYDSLQIFNKKLYKSMYADTLIDIKYVSTGTNIRSLRIY